MLIEIGIGILIAVAFYFAGKTAKGAAIKSEIEAEFVKIEKTAVADVKSLIATVRAKL